MAPAAIDWPIDVLDRLHFARIDDLPDTPGVTAGSLDDAVPRGLTNT